MDKIKHNQFLKGYLGLPTTPESLKMMLNTKKEKEISAMKTLEYLGYTYHGGEYWKPPLGKSQ